MLWLTAVNKVLWLTAVNKVLWLTAVNKVLVSEPYRERSNATGLAASLPA
jgi:hypothetical protein